MPPWSVTTFRYHIQSGATVQFHGDEPCTVAPSQDMSVPQASISISYVCMSCWHDEVMTCHEKCI